MKQDSLRANSRLLGISFLLLCSAISMGIVRPMLPLYLTSLKLEPALVGIVVSVSMAGMMLGESLSGIIADRFGMLLPLLLGTLACGLALFGFNLGTALALLILFSFLWGSLRVLMIGPVRGYMAEIAPLNRRATYIAISSAILSLSRGVGALPGGIIADNLGYNWIFWVAGAVAIFGGLGLISIRKPVRRSAADTAPNIRDSNPKGWLPAFIVLILIGIFGFLNISILLTYVPLLGTQVMGISATSVGLIFTVNGLATMAFSVPAGVIADKIGKRTNMIAGLILCALAMGLISFVRDFYWIIGLGVIHALGMAFFMTAAISILAEFIPRGRLATFIGLYGGIGENSGLMLGSVIGGFIWESLGVSATFLTAVIACGLGIVLCFLLKRIMEPQVRNANLP